MLIDATIETLKLVPISNNTTVKAFNLDTEVLALVTEVLALVIKVFLLDTEVLSEILNLCQE